MKIVVIGNCQAQILESLIAVGSGADYRSLPPNFMLDESHRSLFDEVVDGADHVFVQRTSDSFGMEWARSNRVKARRIGRVSVYPNLYFDGYFPGTQYLYHGRWNKVQSPLVDYHFADVLAAFRAGLPRERAMDTLLYASEGHADPFEASLDELRSRESDCDIVMSDTIASHIGQRQCFWTPNHPDTTLLLELASKLCQAIDLPFTPEKCHDFPYRLDGVIIPVLPKIIRRYDLPYQVPDRFKGVQWHFDDVDQIVLGDARLLRAGELVSDFYEIYDRVLR